MNVTKLLENSQQIASSNAELFFSNSEKLIHINFPNSNIYFVDNSTRVLFENVVYTIIEKSFPFDRYDLLEIYLHNKVAEGNKILIRSIYEHIIGNKRIQLDYILIPPPIGIDKEILESKNIYIKTRKDFDYWNEIHPGSNKIEVLADEYLRLELESKEAFTKYIETINKKQSLKSNEN